MRPAKSSNPERAFGGPPRDVTDVFVSIIIPVHNAERHLRKCVRNVRRYTSLPHELIIVDNASRDGAREYARTLSDAKVMAFSRNRGFARAVNAGMRLAKGDFFLWLNSDALVTPEWLEGLLAHWFSQKRVAGVGPCTDCHPVPQFCVPPPAEEKDIVPFSVAWRLRNIGRAKEVIGLTGFCFLTAREVVRKLGWLDRRFFPAGFEDYDFCVRARKAGYKIILAEDVYVHHAGGGSYESAEEKERVLEKTRRMFIAKWGRRLAVPYLRKLESL